MPNRQELINQLRQVLRKNMREEELPEFIEPELGELPTIEGAEMEPELAELGDFEGSISEDIGEEELEDESLPMMEIEGEDEERFREPAAEDEMLLGETGEVEESLEDMVQGSGEDGVSTLEDIASLGEEGQDETLLRALRAIMGR